MLELRRLCLLPLDDLLSMTQRFINPKASRLGVSRLLRCEGMEASNSLSNTGVAVNLSFDLIGFGITAAQLGSHVSIKDVRLIKSPVAVDDTATLNEDNSITINAKANDLNQYSNTAGEASNTATVNLTGTPGNDAPVAADVAVTTLEDTLATTSLIATDVVNTSASLQFTIQTQPQTQYGSHVHQKSVNQPALTYILSSHILTR